MDDRLIDESGDLMARGGSNAFLTPDELAESLGIPRRTLMRSYRTWGLRSHKIGRVVRFRERDVEGWLTTTEQPVCTNADV